MLPNFFPCAFNLVSIGRLQKENPIKRLLSFCHCLFCIPLSLSLDIVQHHLQRLHFQGFPVISEALERQD